MNESIGRIRQLQEGLKKTTENIIFFLKGFPQDIDRYDGIDCQLSLTGPTEITLEWYERNSLLISFSEEKTYYYVYYEPNTNTQIIERGIPVNDPIPKKLLELLKRF